MRLGYCRASTDGVSRSDLDTLEACGCDQILIDSVQRGRSRVLNARIAALKTGDSLVVVRLNHLAPMPMLLSFLADLVARGIAVQSLADRLHTVDPGVSATLMLLSRYLIRSAAGEHRRGRPPAMKPADVERARRMIFEENVSVARVAAALGVSRSTLYRYLPAA